MEGNANTVISITGEELSKSLNNIIEEARSLREGLPKWVERHNPESKDKSIMQSGIYIADYSENAITDAVYLYVKDVEIKNKVVRKKVYLAIGCQSIMIGTISLDNVHPDRIAEWQADFTRLDSSSDHGTVFLIPETNKYANVKSFAALDIKKFSDNEKKELNRCFFNIVKYYHVGTEIKADEKYQLVLRNEIIDHAQPLFGSKYESKPSEIKPSDNSKNRNDDSKNDGHKSMSVNDIVLVSVASLGLAAIISFVYNRLYNRINPNNPGNNMLVLNPENVGIIRDLVLAGQYAPPPVEEERTQPSHYRKLVPSSQNKQQVPTDNFEFGEDNTQEEINTSPEQVEPLAMSFGKLHSPLSCTIPHHGWGQSSISSRGGAVGWRPSSSSSTTAAFYSNQNNGLTPRLSSSSSATAAFYPPTEMALRNAQIAEHPLSVFSRSEMDEDEVLSELSYSQRTGRSLNRKRLPSNSDRDDASRSTKKSRVDKVAKIDQVVERDLGFVGAHMLGTGGTSSKGFFWNSNYELQPGAGEDGEISIAKQKLLPYMKRLIDYILAKQEDNFLTDATRASIIETIDEIRKDDGTLNFRAAQEQEQEQEEEPKKKKVKKGSGAGQESAFESVLEQLSLLKEGSRTKPEKILSRSLNICEENAKKLLKSIRVLTEDNSALTEEQKVELYFEYILYRMKEGFASQYKKSLRTLYKSASDILRPQILAFFGAEFLAIIGVTVKAFDMDSYEEMMFANSTIEMEYEEYESINNATDSDYELPESGIDDTDFSYLDYQDLKVEEKTGDTWLSKAESLAKFIACVSVSPSSASMAICANEEYMKNLPVVTNVAEVLFKANVCHLLSPTPVLRVVCSSGFDLLEGKGVDANDVALNAFYALAGQLLIGAAYEYLL